MKKNLLGTISICKKASKLILGADIVVDACETSKARLVLLSSDCSPNTKKKIKQSADFNGVSVITVPCTKEEIGSACGKAAVAACAITDTGLAASLGKTLKAMSSGYDDMSEKLDLKLQRKHERVERKKDSGNMVREKKPKIDFYYDAEHEFKNKQKENSPNKTSEKPKFDRENKSSDKPRFDKDKRFSDKPKFDKDKRFSDKPKYDKDKKFSDKPRFDKDNKSSEKPRFDKDKRFSDKPKFERDKKFSDKTRFDKENRSSDKPKFDKDKKFSDKRDRNYSDKKPEYTRTSTNSDEAPKNGVKWSQFNKRK